MKKSILSVISVGVLIHSVFINASDLEHIIVTGTHTAVSQEQLSSSSTVLDQSTIARLNKRSLAELLKTVPGVLVEEQGGAGGLVSVSLRGGEFNFTLVMVDGVPLNDPTNTRGGSFDFGSLNIDNIERIEIVRGPQSAIYGSDALSGVINIITGAPHSTPSRNLMLEVSEYGYRKAGVALSGGGDGLRYNLQLSQFKSGEPVSGSARDNDDAALSVTLQASEQHRFDISYKYADGERRSYPEQSGGPLMALSDALDSGDYRDQSWRLQWQYAVTSYWHSSVETSRYQRDEDYSSPGIVPFTNVPPNDAQTEFVRENLRWVNRLGNNRNWLHLGADQRIEKGSSEGMVDFFGFLMPTRFELDRVTRGIFADANIGLTEKTQLQLSARYDDPDVGDMEDSYGLGFKHHLSPAWVVRANWGQAFKLPSFFALGHSLTGNPSLVPETAESWDLSIDWHLGEHAGSLTYFNNHYKELVTFDDISFTNVNSDSVDAQGLEGQWYWRPVKWPVEIFSSITYTDINAQDPTLRLTGRPEWQGGVLINYPLSADWQLSVDYRYTGQQYAGSQHTGSGTVTELAAYQRVDLALLWRYSSDLRLTVALDNSLNESYQTAVGFPGTGRMLRAGVNFSF